MSPSWEDRTRVDRVDLGRPIVGPQFSGENGDPDIRENVHDPETRLGMGRQGSSLAGV